MKELRALKLLKAFSNAMFVTKEDILKINEAIKELEELNNRSCKSCKWFAKYEKKDYGDCFGGAR